MRLLAGAFLVACSVAYGLYAIDDPAGASETALPSAFVAMMVTLLVIHWHGRRQRGRL